MIAGLGDERFLSLQTFRPSGDPVSTTVWFAPLGDGLVVGTHRDSGKIRRLAVDPAVRFAAANYRGLEKTAYSDGIARILEGPEADAAFGALDEKYGWQWNTFARRIDCYLLIEAV